MDAFFKYFLIVILDKKILIYLVLKLATVLPVDLTNCAWSQLGLYIIILIFNKQYRVCVLPNIKYLFIKYLYTYLCVCECVYLIIIMCVYVCVCLYPY